MAAPPCSCCTSRCNRVRLRDSCRPSLLAIPCGERSDSGPLLSRRRRCTRPLRFQSVTPTCQRCQVAGSRLARRPIGPCTGAYRDRGQITHSQISKLGIRAVRRIHLGVLLGIPKMGTHRKIKNIGDVRTTWQSFRAIITFGFLNSWNFMEYLYRPPRTEP